MPIPVYKELDLEISRADETRYRAHITQSPSGEASEHFASPFSEEELNLHRLKIGTARGRSRRGATRDMAPAEDFGRKLFAQVFTGKVGECLANCLSQLDANTIPGLRLNLRLVDVPELADLPWEFLYHADRGFIALSHRTPIVRYVDMLRPVFPLPVVAPLRILTIVSSPTDFEPLDGEREEANLRNALKELEDQNLVVAEFLVPPTLSALQRRLRGDEIHVLHFIGHGSWDERAGNGMLVFENNQRRGAEVSAEDLAMMLRDVKSLRLVVLNACEGGRTSPTDPFGGVATTIIGCGVPAVLAMQFEISDAAAVQMGQAFYQAIADGYPAEAALAEARKAMRAASGGSEWGTPVLYTRSRDGRLFDFMQSKEGAGARPLSKSNPMPEESSETDREETKSVRNPSVGRFARGEVNRETRLEKENQRLKQLVAELSLSNQELKEKVEQRG